MQMMILWGGGEMNFLKSSLKREDFSVEREHIFL